MSKLDVYLHLRIDRPTGWTVEKHPLGQRFVDKVYEFMAMPLLGDNERLEFNLVINLDMGVSFNTALNELYSGSILSLPKKVVICRYVDNRMYSKSNLKTECVDAFLSSIGKELALYLMRFYYEGYEKYYAILNDLYGKPYEFINEDMEYLMESIKVYEDGTNFYSSLTPYSSNASIFVDILSRLNGKPVEEYKGMYCYEEWQFNSASSFITRDTEYTNVVGIDEVM